MKEADHAHVQVTSQPWEGVKSVDEARAFHEGYIAGLTAYARACGHSGLKSENGQLAMLMHDQGWKTLEAFEALS